MAEDIRVAALSGSLRKGSFNTATLQTVAELAPASMHIDVLTLHDVELFNEDVEAEGWPPNVSALRDKVAAASAVMIATPEYNYSVPGVLKNAIDWLSRPTGKGPIVGKPLAIIGASPSKVGTARAQAHLRQIAFYNAMPLLPSAEVIISQAPSQFDDHGRLTNSDTREFLKSMLKEFEGWIVKQKAA
ncbi:MAG: NAD(P)H-dependent oxidoreductase [Alphaproteobacteria bacterium]|nr:NAD(P)H-dependent oxidoreductase [Alphaproteobacteria bacterium]